MQQRRQGSSPLPTWGGRMSAVLGTCAIIGAAACSDVPTGVEPARPVDVLEANVQRESGVVEVVCTTSRATPGGEYAYEYGLLTVRLPASTRAADGRVRAYRYRGYAERQRVVLAADCAIPNTEAAYKQMNLHFGVKPENARKGWKDGGAGLMSTDYLIDGLVVNACRNGGEWPECEAPPKETEPCWGFSECGYGGGGYTPTGSGDGPDPQWNDGTGRPPCKRDANGHCITRKPTNEEWERFRAQVAKIKTVSAECAGAKQGLEGLLAAGSGAERIRFWDGYDFQGFDPATGAPQQREGQNLSDAQGRYIEFDSHWVFADLELMVHEALHLYLHLNNISIPGDDDVWINQIAPSCL